MISQSRLMAAVAVGVMVLSGCGVHSSHLLQGSGSTGRYTAEGSNGDSLDDAGIQDDAAQQVIERWNVAAKGVTAPFPGGPGVADFVWTEKDTFPHPTLKGGNADAYEAFAGVFIKFFDTAGNLDFLRQNDMLNMSLTNLESTWYFNQIATDFSEPTYLPGFFSGATRRNLARIRDVLNENPPLDPRVPFVSGIVVKGQDGEILTAPYRVQVGESLTVEIEASDSAGRPLEYRFTKSNHCMVVYYSDWSTVSSGMLAFDSNDVSSCSRITVGIRNDDGIDYDSESFGDLQYPLELDVR